MANLNRIILIGRLASNPDERATLDGIPMSKFKMRVDRPQGGADLFDIIAWRRLAEICNSYLKDGRLVLIEGRIQVRSFEDQTGVRRWVTEIVARNMQMLEKSGVTSRPETDELESDLPF